MKNNDLFSNSPLDMKDILEETLKIELQLCIFPMPAFEEKRGDWYENLHDLEDHWLKDYL